MVIKFTNYANGIHNLTVEKSAESLKLPPEFEGNVKVDCKMDKSVHQIVLDCKLSALANLKCDRCTEEVKNNIGTEFRLVYIFSNVPIENDDINLQYLTPEESKIDITEEVVEYCYLSIPLKILCNEDCKGLCVSCGINLNMESCNCDNTFTNSTWEKLSNLKI